MYGDVKTDMNRYPCILAQQFCPVSTARLALLMVGIRVDDHQCLRHRGLRGLFRSLLSASLQRRSVRPNGWMYHHLSSSISIDHIDGLIQCLVLAFSLCQSDHGFHP